MSSDPPTTEPSGQETEKVEESANDLISPGIRFNLEEISKTILPISTIWQRQDKPDQVSNTEKSDSSSSGYEENEALDKSSPGNPEGAGKVVMPKRKRKRKRKRKTKSPEVPIPRERPHKRRKLGREVEPENVHIRFDEDGVPDKIIEEEPHKLKARIVRALTFNLKVFESFANNTIVEIKELAPVAVSPNIERPLDLMPRIIKGILVQA